MLTDQQITQTMCVYMDELKRPSTIKEISTYVSIQLKLKPLESLQLANEIKQSLKLGVEIGFIFQAGEKYSRLPITAEHAIAVKKDQENAEQVGSENQGGTRPNTRSRDKVMHSCDEVTMAPAAPINRKTKANSPVQTSVASKTKIPAKKRAASKAECSPLVKRVLRKRSPAKQK